jgi:hypothetical protein
VTPKQVTHCRPYLTQHQTLRLLSLLGFIPTRRDAPIAKKLRDELKKAAEGDRKHAEWLASQSAT